MSIRSLKTEIMNYDSHFMYVEEYTFLIFQNIRDNIIIDSLHKMVVPLDVETYIGYEVP